MAANLIDYVLISWPNQLPERLVDLIQYRCLHDNGVETSPTPNVIASIRQESARTWLTMDQKY